MGSAYTGETQRLDSEPNPFEGELRQLVMNDPIVHAAYTHYRTGGMTMQEALVAAVKALAEANREYQRLLKQHLEASPAIKYRR